MKQIEPINEPRRFEVEELFFSTTDLKGHIQRGNSVFQRIAGYSWAEMHNKPHNVIRHPDMPRVVFHLLWDYVQDGRPIVAYVKNLAHDGRYYWVMALVTPMSGGYLSVRFKPTSPLRNAVEQLYGELRAVEAAIEDQSHDRKAAIAASATTLTSALQKLGFSGYDEFMRHAMKTEMQSREAKLHAGGTQSADFSLAGLDSLSAQAALFDRLLFVLHGLFRDLESYVGISQGVREKSAGVADISEALRVSALNGAIEADKIGTKATGLRPVLDWLRGLSAEITRQGAVFSATLNELVSEVDLVVFDLMAAKLQIEMTAKFAHEICGDDAERDDAATVDSVGSLHTCSCETIRRALRRLIDMRDRLAVLSVSQTSLIQASHSLRPIYLTGRIEMAEGVGARLASVFDDVGGQLSETAESLSGLGKILLELSGHLTRGLAHGDEIEATIAQIDSRIHIAY